MYSLSAKTVSVRKSSTLSAASNYAGTRSERVHCRGRHSRKAVNRRDVRVCTQPENIISLRANVKRSAFTA